MTGLVILLFVASIGGGAYYFDKSRKQEALLKNPEEMTKLETKSVTDKVSKLMELPGGEPSIATVLDKEKLKDQPFFAKSENGDKILIYADAKTAILYRPSTNKIIIVAPMDTTATPAPTAEATAKPTAKPVATPEAGI